MKICPQCSSGRVRISYPRSLSENFLRTWLGYRFYRCHQCNWRGMEHPLIRAAKTTRSSKKSSNKYSGKLSGWKLILLYVLVLLVALALIFVIISMGDAPPSPPQ